MLAEPSKATPAIVFVAANFVAVAELPEVSAALLGMSPDTISPLIVAELLFSTLFNVRSVFNSAVVLDFTTPLSSTNIFQPLLLEAYVDDRLPAIVKFPDSSMVQTTVPAWSFTFTAFVPFPSVSKFKLMSVLLPISSVDIELTDILESRLTVASPEVPPLTLILVPPITDVISPAVTSVSFIFDILVFLAITFY